LILCEAPANRSQTNFEDEEARRKKKKKQLRMKEEPLLQLPFFPLPHHHCDPNPYSTAIKDVPSDLLWNPFLSKPSLGEREGEGDFEQYNKMENKPAFKPVSLFSLRT